MLFHQPFINRVAESLPEADVLLGKPMPVSAAAEFYRQRPDTGFDPARQLRWLLDTPQRVAQYAALAEQLQQDMLACIELDVGLHRGGVQGDRELLEMLDLVSRSPRLQFTGFMGYEPHVVKVPGDPLKYRDQAMAAYRHYVDIAREQLGEQWPEDAVLNCGGSPTYQLYDDGDYPFNELATGSCLVKPTDFDIPTLAAHPGRPRPRRLYCHPGTQDLGGCADPGDRPGPAAEPLGPKPAAHGVYLRRLLEGAAGVTRGAVTQSPVWPIHQPGDAQRFPRHRPGGGRLGLPAPHPERVRVPAVR
jgi:D-serine deaminase-like pyridoxal phosphate-dependent protein